MSSYGSEVTDKELLSKLNGRNSYGPPVSDPVLLNKLNSSKSGKTTESNNFFDIDKHENIAPLREATKNLGDSYKAAVQAYINSPEEFANVFGKHLYNKFDFAPNNTAGKVGNAIGDIASFFQPGEAVKLGIGGLKMLPGAKNAIESAHLAMKSSPITNVISSLTKNIAQGALFQKSKVPESEPVDVAKAGAIGGAFPLAISALGSNNPLLSLGAKLGVGGALGYHYGGFPGAAEGAATAVAIPKALSEMGIGIHKPVSSEFLNESPNALAKSRYDAGNRLGATVRPSEAFDNPAIGANEGRISNTETGNNAISDLSKERVVKQKNAINKLLNDIYPKTKKSGNAIRDLYENAYQHDLSETQVNALLEDPLIKQAHDSVKSDPVYMKKLKDIPENNFAYLDQMKRYLGAQSKKASRLGDDVASKEYGDSSKALIKEMDEKYPGYADARSAAQVKIVRKQLEKAIGTKEINGRTFFDTVLRNDNKYQKLMSDLKNSPEALQQVKDMKLAWEHLIGKDTVRKSAGESARSTNTARQDVSKFWNLFKDTVGAPRDVERAEFIHDPKWWDKFDEVNKYKDKLKRKEALFNLFSEASSPLLLESAKITRK